VVGPARKSNLTKRFAAAISPSEALLSSVFSPLAIHRPYLAGSVSSNQAAASQLARKWLPLGLHRNHGRGRNHFTKGSPVASLPVVRDYMDPVVPTLSADTGILDAVDFLLSHQVTGAPVVDANGTVVGIVTEKDCLRLLSTGMEADVPRGTVRDFMSTEVATVSPGMNIYYVAGLFLKAAYRRLPVVENGRLIGAITRFDILRVIQANLKELPAATR
jgi:CBS domain-containing protein